VAIVGFFVLATVGACSGVPTLPCGLRAAGGAAALYVLTVLAGRVVIGILAGVIAAERRRQAGEEKT
jgi:predicted branched-subunit amino acid permease